MSKYLEMKTKEKQRFEELKEDILEKIVDLQKNVRKLYFLNDEFIDNEEFVQEQIKKIDEFYLIIKESKYE